MIIPSIEDAQRIVIKIGSALVVDQHQAAARTAWLDSVAADIQTLRAHGTDVIVVSSGAIALARRTLGLTQKRLRLEEKAGRRCGRSDPPCTGLDRGALRSSLDRRPASADPG